MHAVPEPAVSIATSSDSAIAGDPFVLTCSVTNLPDDLIASPMLGWSGPGVDQSNVQVLSEGSNLSLSFSPLQTSQGGVYTCNTTLISPEAGINITETLILCSVSSHCFVDVAVGDTWQKQTTFRDPHKFAPSES